MNLDTMPPRQRRRPQIVPRSGRRHAQRLVPRLRLTSRSLTAYVAAVPSAGWGERECQRQLIQCRGVFEATFGTPCYIDGASSWIAISGFATVTATTTSRTDVANGR